MHILIVNLAKIPVFAYGGTERVIWDLAKKLVEYGHKITFLVPEGSTCPFATILPVNIQKPWYQQIPDDVDLVHFQFHPHCELDQPYLVTHHTNCYNPISFPRNTVFVSQSHAKNYNASAFVYNGLDWSNYGPVNFQLPRKHYHFLGKGDWYVKNLLGTLKIANQAGVKLRILGGKRMWVKRRNFRMTLSLNTRFHPSIGGQDKFHLLNTSKGLIFPVTWHEPFGLAVIESLYFGCPVFATPYGALPELVPSHCGFLSNSSKTLINAILESKYEPEQCHIHALHEFNAYNMVNSYLEKYHTVLAGQFLNESAPFFTNASSGHHLPWLT